MRSRCSTPGILGSEVPYLWIKEGLVFMMALHVDDQRWMRRMVALAVVPSTPLNPVKPLNPETRFNPETSVCAVKPLGPVEPLNPGNF